jgi:hypothetical protein
MVSFMRLSAAQEGRLAAARRADEGGDMLRAMSIDTSSIACFLAIETSTLRA